MKKKHTHPPKKTGKDFNLLIVVKGSRRTFIDMLLEVLSLKYKVLYTKIGKDTVTELPKAILNPDKGYNAAIIEMHEEYNSDISKFFTSLKPDIYLEIEEGAVLNSDNSHLIYATNIKEFWNNNNIGVSFTIHYKEKKYLTTLPFLGRHNVQIALLTLKVGLCAGVDLLKAVNALAVYHQPSLGLETSVIGGVRFIRDCLSEKKEYQTAIDTLSALEGNRIAIIGDLSENSDNSQTLYREIAEYTIGKIEKVYYIGNHTKDFTEGRKDSVTFSTKKNLNCELLRIVVDGELKSGDTILITGLNSSKLWEQYELLKRILTGGSPLRAQTRLLVDIGALKHNYAAIKNYVGNVKILPVIKANAYGSGADILGEIYRDCDFFGVADLREAEELHKVMPMSKFLLLYQPLVEEINCIIERDYVVTSASDIDFIIKLNRAAVKADKKITVHIEIDTGMCRLGVPVDYSEEFALAISHCKNLIVEGIYTHYSSADLYTESALDFTAMQTQQFKKALNIFEKIIGNIKYKHAAAGAAIFNPRAELFNMVRPGYILRGYYPCEEMKSKIHLCPALKFASKVTQVKELKKGASISYSGTFVTKRKTLIAEIPVGYSDGLMRSLSNKGAFVINGQLAPIAGNVTMDYTMVDVTDITPPVTAGDDVFIFDNDNMTIEKIAELSGTIGYEIITNIREKTDRIEFF